ncbi:uncharacterized protein B0I36DRAFT_250962 [Microdochium trichocladiopsis]|uniref:Ferric oxidoreductase domain-containing protein n=1 Tax=Microdochium trichocladiopsis TaxID=1682393 RepID=A0A9P8XXS8_9PEZI|nr:uncharacterized protein B0I36DRAFT_250962 [Microdochium trichocladiopsis]KAH7024545.1 hypothetical protein B0I36DRAFT_250962 [Microdochium trichocladiopsis]
MANVAAGQSLNASSGFIGKGITMFHPTCASACRDTLAPYRLSCSTVHNTQSSLDHDMEARHITANKRSLPAVNGSVTFETSPGCYAGDMAYLQSVAYCISTRCSHDSSISRGTLEDWWATYLIGSDPTLPKPVVPYREALSHTAAASQWSVIGDNEVLNTPSLSRDAVYLANYNAKYFFELSEERHVDYGLILFISGLVVPIFTSWLRFLPFPHRLTTRLRAIVVDPPLIGRRHREPVGHAFLMPTRGQAIFILYLFAINITLCSFGYTTTPATAGSTNAWFPKPTTELLAYISNRTGILCFANLPLLIVYSARNNPLLLFLTDWSHSTFLLMHRYIAAIATVQAAVHAGIYFYQNLSSGAFLAVTTARFWIWGIVCIGAMVVLLLPASILPLRRRCYEVFLALHVVLAVLVLVAGYLHVWYRFDGRWGYENWLLYLAVPIWGAERVLRILRLARFGIRRATVTLIVDDDGGGRSDTSEYVRVDVPGVVVKGYAYLYFPTLSWRLWENHPFSVAGNMLPVEEPYDGVDLQSYKLERREPKTSSSDHSTRNGSLAEPDGSSIESTSNVFYQRGSTFFVRASGGMTSRLRQLAIRNGGTATLSVLVEGSYVPQSHGGVAKAPNLVVIAGGVGITAVAPLVRARVAGGSLGGRTRLYWGLRSHGLARTAKEAFGQEMFAHGILGGMIVAGDGGGDGRLDIRSILDKEVPNTGHETAVVVCGPERMADEVRQAVAELARDGRQVKLVDEAFSW